MSLIIRCASLAVFTMVPADEAFTRSSKSSVSRKYERWFSANVRSKPSLVTSREVFIAPALFTSTSTTGCEAWSASATRRTSRRSERSPSSNRTWPAPGIARRRVARAAAFSSLRATKVRFAPSFAKASAAASPIPAVAPVRTTYLSRREPYVMRA
jgi:hypothetical protein